MRATGRHRRKQLLCDAARSSSAGHGGIFISSRQQHWMRNNNARLMRHERIAALSASRVARAPSLYSALSIGMLMLAAAPLFFNIKTKGKTASCGCATSLKTSSNNIMYGAQRAVCGNRAGLHRVHNALSRACHWRKTARASARASSAHVTLYTLMAP